MTLEPHIEALIGELELDPNLVRELRITPSELEAEVYLTNDAGSKYLRDDREPAVETMTYSHRAFREVAA